MSTVRDLIKYARFHMSYGKKNVITGKSLRAIVGVERKDAFPEDPCVIEQIVLTQQRGHTECCDITSSVAVACDVIR